jgi:hypothetical protein
MQEIRDPSDWPIRIPPGITRLDLYGEAQMNDFKEENWSTKPTDSLFVSRPPLHFTPVTTGKKFGSFTQE